MFRPAIGTLILAVTLAMAGQAAAEMPMSPALRTDTATVTAKSTEAVPAKPTGQSASEQASDTKTAATRQQSDRRKIIATAPIPPPPRAAATATAPPMPAPVEHATLPVQTAHRRHHARRPHYAYSRYRYIYPYYGGWGAGNPPHLGPNPYSPNGGD